MAALSKPIQYALLLTALAVGWVTFAPSDSDKKPQKAKSTQTRTRATGANTLPTRTLTAPAAHQLAYPQALSRPPVGSAKQDLFAAQDWLAQTRIPTQVQTMTNPMPYIPPAPSPAPVAPPLDYQYVGRLTDGGVLHIYLVVQGSNVVLSTDPKKEGLFVVGDVLANDYRIDSISSTSVQLNYLPLNQVQALSIGG